MVRVVKRAGFSLMEVLVAVLVLAVAGLTGLGVVNNAAQSGSDGSAAELASVLGAQVMDRMLGGGYRLLAAKLKDQASGELDLSGIDGIPQPEGKVQDDRLVLSGTYQLALAAPGLLRVEIALAWVRGGRDEPGKLTLVRYLGDPLCGADVNAPFGALK